MYKFVISGFSDEIDSEIDKQFEVLNKLGIEFFEVRGVDGKNISALSKEELVVLKEKMQKHNIKVSSIGSPIGKINIEDDFDKHFELFKNVVDTAKFLGTKYIRIFSFYYPNDKSAEDYSDEVIKRLEIMVEYAKNNDVILLHENEKDIFGDTAQRCLYLFENIKSPNFKAVFDPANFIQCKNDPQAAFELLKDHIVYVHIKDAQADGSVVPAGFGEANFKLLIAKLKKMSYNGFLSLEPHLGSFAGLENLETDDKMTSLDKSDASKFELAYNSLNKIIMED